MKGGKVQTSEFDKIPLFVQNYQLKQLKSILNNQNK